MKVLLIGFHYIEPGNRLKLRKLRARGVDLKVLVPRRWRTDLARYRLERSSEEKDYVICPRALFKNDATKYFYPRLGSILKKENPDIIHVEEEPWSFITALTMRLARKRRAKKIFFTWQNVFRELGSPRRQFERYTLAQADLAISGNADGREVLLQKGFTGDIEVLPQFGVDLDRFNLRKGERGVPLSIGFFGRLVEQKGVLDLLDAVERLATDARLEYIGDGPLFDELAARAERSPASVTLTKSVPSEDVPKKMLEFDCIVLPSKQKGSWKEQFGRVLAEAMALGVNVIGSSSGEIPHVIGDAGYIFPENDTDALRDALGRVMVEDLRARQMAEQGVRRVKERFSMDSICDKTVEIYTKVLEQ